MMKESIHKYLEEHNRAILSIADGLLPDLQSCVNAIAGSFSRGGKVLTMGNGGSAADAQHLAAELVGRFMLERQALPAIALTTDSSILTAVGNDYGFDDIFMRQVEALADKDDVVVGISTSGHSANVAKALSLAQQKGCVTIGLLGRDGGVIAGKCDIHLTVPVQETPHIQEAHLVLLHLLCDLVEKELFAKAGKEG